MKLIDCGYVCMVGMNSGNMGVMYFASKEDCMKICSAKETAGTSRGNQWALMWFGVDNMLVQPPSFMEEKHVYEDDGRYDDLFESLGVQTYSLSLLFSAIRKARKKIGCVPLYDIKTGKNLIEKCEWVRNVCADIEI